MVVLLERASARAELDGALDALRHDPENRRARPGPGLRHRGGGAASPAGRLGVVVARIGSSLEFLRHEVASTPLAEPVGELDDDRRAALVNGVEEALADFVDDEGLVVVLPTWLAIAVR
jgi:hypothetical protein